MHSMNLHQDFKPYHVDEIPINSRETVELLSNLNRTNINQTLSISESWQLNKAYIIQNKIFDRDFNDKREEIQEQSYYHDHWDVRFGFLASLNDNMIDKLAEEGLEIKTYPYNYLGHNTSGLHISMNADVCLNEARNKIGIGNEITLLIFKYMLGKRKMVAMYDPKVLLAPTPSFDSHVCEERPVPKESIATQYIKSLVYLYEFANDNLDPVMRPRHCCPIGALILKNTDSFEILDLTETDSTDVQAPYSKNSFPSKAKTLLPKSHLWNVPYPMVNDDKGVIGTRARPYEMDRGFDASATWRDDKADRANKWKEGGISVYGGIKYNNLLNSSTNRIGKSYIN